MDSKQDPNPQSKTADTMSSFGEGYSTRSDEEGFGGIYGGNQYFPKDRNDNNNNTNDHQGKISHGNNTPAEFEQNQGSEVKEKERGRQQNQVAN